ncbi:hypothetical protein [Nostoc sp.]|uniref:hypothetical protein n=1 Tax=Nostoc sp. TaxID=1180 RepID=UPI002FF76A14
MPKGSLIQVNRQMMPFLLKQIGLTVPNSLPAAFFLLKLRFNSNNLSGLHGAIAAL